MEKAPDTALAISQGSQKQRSVGDRLIAGDVFGLTMDLINNVCELLIQNICNVCLYIWRCSEIILLGFKWTLNMSVCTLVY